MYSWVKVNDQLPEDNREVLVIMENGDYFLANHLFGAWCETTEDIQLYDVTHWVSLPEPPKEHP